MKKTYSAPMVHAVELDTDAICLNIGSDPADLTPAGVRYRRGRFTTEELLLNEDIYDDSFVDE